MFTMIEQHCVEVCKGDKLLGYAIFFSGQWDAWITKGRDKMVCLGSFEERATAILAVKGPS